MEWVNLVCDTERLDLGTGNTRIQLLVLQRQMLNIFTLLLRHHYREEDLHYAKGNLQEV